MVIKNMHTHEKKKKKDFIMTKHMKKNKYIVS